jgi:serine/threonine protein kinase/predicted Zn-dependent protease
MSPALIEGAARDYAVFRRRSGDPAAVEQSIRRFEELCHSEPQRASRLAHAVTRLPEVGDVFAGFRLVGELGRGAFGRVFLAEQTDLAGRPVALKVTPDADGGESQTLAQLQHTNVMPIYSVHHAGPLQAVCMPYFGATTLADVLDTVRLSGALPASGKGLLSTLQDRRSTVERSLPPGSRSRLRPASQPPAPPPNAVPLTPGQVPERLPTAVGTVATATLEMLGQLSYVEAVLWVAARLADGLAHAHERGILHRDLKPANVLLSDEGQPLLLDFNLAADEKDKAARAQIGGTLPYMAPEHLAAFQGSAQRVDARCDLYALGVLLFELLTGRAPYKAPSGPMVKVLPQMIAERQRVPRLRSFNRAVPCAVESIVRKLLAPDPARRYQTARQLQEDLERQMRNEPLRYAPDRSLSERAGKLLRRHPKRVMTLAVTTVAAVVVGAFALYADVQKKAALLQEEVAIHDAIHVADLTERDAISAQYLLAPRPDGDRQVREGREIVHGILARYDVEADPDAWQGRTQFQLLPAERQNEVRVKIGDLLLALSRESEQAAADDHKSPTARKAAEESRQWFTDLASKCLPEGEKAASRREIHELARKASEGHWAEVLPRLKEITQQDPKDAYAWSLRGYCLFHSHTQEHWSEASDCYTHCLALQSDNAWACFSRGLIRMHQMNFTGAVADFDKVIRLRPEHLDLATVYAERAIAKDNRKQHKEALADLDMAVENGFPKGRADFRRASILKRMGDAKEAKRIRAEALRQEPSDIYGWIDRGLARLDTEPDKALADFDRALELNPKSLQALWNKAVVLSEKLHDLKSARPVYDRLVSDYPEELRLRTGRAVLLARLGETDDARREAHEVEAKLGQRRDDMALFLRYQLGSLYALTAAKYPEDRREALRLIASAFAKGFQSVEYLDTDDDLTPIRADAEFRKLSEIVHALFRAGS